MSFLDWETDDDGDFVITAGDFTDTEGHRATIQDVMFRLKSALMDYKVDPDLPAALDDFIGKPNSSDTGEAIERRVKYSLTRDGKYQPTNFQVTVAPHGRHELGIYLFIIPGLGTNGGLTNLSFTFDLVTGSISLLTD